MCGNEDTRCGSGERGVCMCCRETWQNGIVVESIRVCAREVQWETEPQTGGSLCARSAPASPLPHQHCFSCKPKLSVGLDGQGIMSVQEAEYHQEGSQEAGGSPQRDSTTL